MDVEFILIQIAVYIIFLLIMTIFLKIALGFFSKSKNTDFSRVFITSFLITLIFFLFTYLLPGIIGLIIALVIIWILISAMHGTGFVNAIIISIVAIILYIIVLWIISVLFGITLLIIF